MVGGARQHLGRTIDERDDDEAVLLHIRARLEVLHGFLRRTSSGRLHLLPNLAHDACWGGGAA